MYSLLEVPDKLERRTGTLGPRSHVNPHILPPITDQPGASDSTRRQEAKLSLVVPSCCHLFPALSPVLGATTARGKENLPALHHSMLPNPHPILGT